MTDDELDEIKKRADAAGYDVGNADVRALVEEVQRMWSVCDRYERMEQLMNADNPMFVGRGLVPAEDAIDERLTRLFDKLTDHEGVKRQAAAEEREYICKEMETYGWDDACVIVPWTRELPVR